MANRTALSVPRRQPLYAYPLQVLRDNPQCYLRGNDANGSTSATDSTIWKNTGTYGGSILYQQTSIFSGDPSTGFKQQDTQSYCYAPLTTTQQSETTLEGIFKVPDANSSGCFMTFGEPSTSGWGFGIGGTGLNNAGLHLFLLTSFGGGTTLTIPGAALIAGTWTHVAVVLTAGNFLVYLAGSWVATVASPGLPVAPATLNFIGRAQGYGPIASFSDCAFYNYPLSAQKIMSHAILAV